MVSEPRGLTDKRPLFLNAIVFQNEYRIGIITFRVIKPIRTKESKQSEHLFLF